MKASTLLARLFLCCAALCTSLASAVPLTWTLQGVNFQDGASASGSFMIESTTGDLLSWNITTTPGMLAGFNFNAGNSTVYGRDIWGAPNAYTITRTSPFANPYLQMTFASALT